MLAVDDVKRAVAPAISIQDLTFGYGEGFRLTIPKWELPPGTVHLITGPSGSGKTTLLRLISGLATPESGQIELQGQALHALNLADQRRLRLQRLGLVFQDFSLVDYLSSEENVLLPSRFTATTDEDGPMPPGGQTRADWLEQLKQALDLAPLWERRVSRLSQGERQRVAVARAMHHRPNLLLADEPTASLDTRRRDQVAELLSNYAAVGGSVLMITHDPSLMERFPNQDPVEAWRS